jgi:hypothetical protein
MYDLRNDCLDVTVCKVCANGVSIVTLVCQQRLRRPLRQGDQRVISLAIRRFANCQMEKRVVVRGRQPDSEAYW